MVGEGVSLGGRWGCSWCGQGWDRKGWANKIRTRQRCDHRPNIARRPTQAGVRSGSFANPLGAAFGEASWANGYRSLQDYCSRAWCRLELLLCSSLPLVEGGFRCLHYP